MFPESPLLGTLVVSPSVRVFPVLWVPPGTRRRSLHPSDPGSVGTTDKRHVRLDRGSTDDKDQEINFPVRRLGDEKRTPLPRTYRPGSRGQDRRSLLRADVPGAAAPTLPPNNVRKGDERDTRLPTVPLPWTSGWGSSHRPSIVWKLVITRSKHLFLICFTSTSHLQTTFYVMKECVYLWYYIQDK